MKCPCSVMLKWSTDWRPAELTTDHSTSSYGQPVVVADSQPYGPEEVATVRISSAAGCPVELFDAAINAGFHVLGMPSKRPTCRVYVYNENCIQAGQSVPQRIIDEHPDPDNAGDWTLFDGTEAELAELSRERFRQARPGAAGQYDRKAARTLAEAVGVDLDTESQNELRRVFLTAWNGLRTKYADNPARLYRTVEEYKRRLRDAKTGSQARGVIAELCAEGGISRRRYPGACRAIRGVLAMA